MWYKIYKYPAVKFGISVVFNTKIVIIRLLYKVRITFMKAKRNKTIDITVEEGQCYLDRCIAVNSPVDLSNILDRTIKGNTLSGSQS